MAISSLKISLAQLNPTVGAITKNKNKALKVIETECKKGTDLILFPECFLSGYPAEDLLYKSMFLDHLKEALDDLIKQTAHLDIGVIMTTPLTQDEKRYNAAVFFHQGKILQTFTKTHLPNYGVFDEVRVFDVGTPSAPVKFKGVKIGVPICEDIWRDDVVQHYKDQGAKIILIPNASPYETMKNRKRDDVISNHVKKTGLPLVYLNQIGGQDELVFDGASFIQNGDGSIPVTLNGFKEQVLQTEWQNQDGKWICTTQSHRNNTEYLETLYQALTLGLRDYVEKNGFHGVILGMSGGIDSALAAAIAVDALGPDKVKAVMMPSYHTSQESLDDAAECTQLLGADYETISIVPAIDAFESMLEKHLEKGSPGITEENIQSRARGLTLMALSNKLGHMVIATGNKSEYATGYATLYGDMCGGFAVIKDVYKTTVFKLCEWRNENHPKDAKGPVGRVIPQNIINKPPTAELRPDQKDEDSLPPYPILDGILRGLIEQEKSLQTLMDEKYDEQTILDVWELLDRSEYKRRQAPPGVKLTDRAFGKERRYPITNGFATEMKD